MDFKIFMRNSCLLLFFIYSLDAWCQSYWSKRYDLDSGNDYGTQIVEYNNKLIVLIKAFCEINTRECEGFICLDQDGTMLWKTVLYDTLDTNYFEAMVVKQDTIVINMDYSGLEERHYALVFFDTTGNEVRRKDYFYPGLPDYHVARGITSYNDRAFVSFDAKPDSQSRSREFIRAYDVGWNILWEVSVPNTFLNLTWCDVEATTDGGMVALYSSFETSGRKMATIEKYDADGMMEWQTPLPHIGGFSSGWVRLDNHPDGGYVGIWQFDTAQTHITAWPTILFKLNSEGDIEWEKMELTEQIWFYDVFCTQNGDIVGCGIAEDWVWTTDDPEYYVGYVARFNSDGEKLWDRKIAEETDGADFYELYSGIELSNGDLAFTGLISDTIFGTPDDPTPGNVWVLKLDSMGCLSPECDEWQHILSSTAEVPQDDPLEFVVFPNPASEYLMLGGRLGVHIRNGDYNATLYDMNAQMIFSQDFNPYMLTEFDVSNLPCGHYVMTVWRDGFLVQSIKVEAR